MTVADKLAGMGNALNNILGDGFEAVVEASGSYITALVSFYPEGEKSSALAQVTMSRPDFRKPVPASLYTEIVREARDKFRNQHTYAHYTATAQTHAWLAYQAIPKI